VFGFAAEQPTGSPVKNPSRTASTTAVGVRAEGLQQSK